MGWAAELWADENNRPISTTDSPTAPQPVPTKIGTWNDALEQKARRCRGCGEWSFTEYCDWCIGMGPW